MPGLSIHVVDVTRGVPAVGMRVRVDRIDAKGRHSVGSGTVGPSGNVEHPMNRGENVQAGTHEAELAVGEWYRAEGLVRDDPAFQEIAVVRFTVLDPAEHVHLPVKLSPWGLSVWRGR